MLVNMFMLSLFLPFSYSLLQFPPSILKLSTQHPPYFFKLSTQHQPAITRIVNWAILPTQGLQFRYTVIRAFSNISAYTKTVQVYSTKNTSMNKFLAQSSSPCLMLGGIPPASLSEGWSWGILSPAFPNGVDSLHNRLLISSSTMHRMPNNNTPPIYQAPIYLGWDMMADILQTIFANWFLSRTIIHLDYNLIEYCCN